MHRQSSTLRTQTTTVQRQGKNAEAAQWLQKALKLDSSLKAYANNDLELLNVNK